MEKGEGNSREPLKKKIREYFSKFGKLSFRSNGWPRLNAPFAFDSALV